MRTAAEWMARRCEECSHTYSGHTYPHEVANPLCAKPCKARGCTCENFREPEKSIEEIQEMAGVDAMTAMGLMLVNAERCRWCDHERKFHLSLSYDFKRHCGHQYCICPDFVDKPKETKMPSFNYAEDKPPLIFQRDVKISASRVTDQVTFTLPCGAKRVMSSKDVAEFKTRLARTLDYLVQAIPVSKEF